MREATEKRKTGLSLPPGDISIDLDGTERGRRKRGCGVVRRSNLLTVEKGSRDPRSKYWDTVSLARVNLRAEDESSRGDPRIRNKNKTMDERKDV